MEKDKRILCYDIINYLGGLFDYDMSCMADEEIIKSVKTLERLSYKDLLAIYELLWQLFNEKFGFGEEG